MNSGTISIQGKIEEVSTTCYHCGDDCNGFELKYDSKNFCCNGCKTVFEILNSEGLDQYYDLEKSPGQKILKGIEDSKYSYLNNATVVNQLLDFKSDTLNKITLFIPQIHCSSCIWLLENLNKLNKGVFKSEVNFGKKKLAITYKPESVKLYDLVMLLASLGYEPSINLASKKAEQKEDKTLLYKLGIAGFCFGNIMLLSFPEYLGITDSGFDNYKYFFSFLIFAFSLPVVFYCASDYLASAFNGLVNKHISIDVPISLGVLVLFTRSVYEIFSYTGAGYLDSLVGLIFFLLIGKWYQSKIYKSLSFDRDYESYFPIAVTKISNRKEEIIQLKDLKVGDILLLRNEELIPADAKLVSGNANIDYSFVTGESEALKKEIGDYLYSGGKQIGGVITVEIQKKVNQSYLTQLWNQDAFTKQKTKYSSLIDSVSKYFTMAILIISSLAAFYWNSVDSSQLFNVVSSILIIACPCALALTIPFTLGTATRVLGEKGLYVKNVETVEKLSEIDTIIFDKTGTITNTNSLSNNFTGSCLNKEELQKVKALTKCSTHPLSQNIYKSISENTDLVCNNFNEIVGKGIQANVESDFVQLGSSSYFNINEKEDTKTKVYLAINNNIKGYFEFENQVREGFHNLFHQLKSKFKLHLLSGDNSKDLERFKSYFETSKIKFNQTPVDKLNYISGLQPSNKVLMVGDGLNDAGALKQSNVGIAISDNVYTFSPACDAILSSSTFAKLGVYIRFAQKSMYFVKLGFILSFLYNIVGITLAVCNLINPLISAILMPLSSVSVILFGTFSIKILAKKYFKV